jgi:DNA-binding transcriptional MerR regulator
MHIGEVAEVTGLTQRTIRYYEELGLLPAPERTQGDFRLYTTRDVRRLSEISRLKHLLGFSLAEIKEIVVAEDAREQLTSDLHAAADPQMRLDTLREFERLATAQLAAIDRKMAQLADLKTDLDSRLARYRENILEVTRAERADGRHL